MSPSDTPDSRGPGNFIKSIIDDELERAQTGG